MNMRILEPETHGGIVLDASTLIANGGVIIAPTDTVYGIACDATNADAVHSVARLKQRPADMPFIVLLSSEMDIASWTEPLAADSLRVWKRCASLPVTFFLPASLRAKNEIVHCGNTIAIRIPRDRFSSELCRVSDTPLLSTSANLHGQPVPTKIAEIDSVLLNSVDLVVDGGVLNSAPSTIVDLSSALPHIVREGTVPRTHLHSLCGIFPPDDY